MVFTRASHRSIIRADVPTPAVAPVAARAVPVDADAAAKASATTKASAKAPATKTPTAAATASSLRCGGRCADKDGRRADEVNEHQRQRGNAARNDIVAFSHFLNSRSVSST